MSDIRTRLSDQSTVMCCDDVIESVFGKFKYRGNKSSSQGITEDAIALFNGKIEVKQTKKALEKVTLQSIEQWTEKNIAPSFAKNKNQFWRNRGQ